MSRWLITGAGGMLGRDLVLMLQRHGEAVTGLTRKDLDITDEVAVARALRWHSPDIIVNCAAWTDVDGAETQEAEALLANGVGARRVAAACAAHHIRLMHVSTDYVFDGDAREPYPEYGPTGPRTAYGRTKLVGEQAVLSLLPHTGYVVRTAWLYGAHGPNFVRAMIRLEKERRAVYVVNDQHGQPTWTADVACRIISLARSCAAAGIYHATSSGHTTWFGLAREIFRLLGADPARVRPTTSSEHPRAALRPAYSVLGHGAWLKVGIEPISDWLDSLERAFPSLGST